MSNCLTSEVEVALVVTSALTHTQKFPFLHYPCSHRGFMQFEVILGMLLSKSFGISSIFFYTLQSPYSLGQTSNMTTLCLWGNLSAVEPLWEGRPS